jgi:hypothetical protein
MIFFVHVLNLRDARQVLDYSECDYVWSRSKESVHVLIGGYNTLIGYNGSTPYLVWLIKKSRGVVGWGGGRGLLAQINQRVVYILNIKILY